MIGSTPNSLDTLPISRPINAGGDLWSVLPDGRPNPQFYGLDWLVGTPEGTKVVSNPFAVGSPAWLQYELQDKAALVLLAGAALVLLLVMGGRRR